MSNFTHTTSGAISMFFYACLAISKTARTSGAMSNFTYTSGAISAF